MSGPGWADVADDLIFLLAQRIIGVPAFVRFSAVCKPWNSVASAAGCCKQVPWLMLIEKEGSILRDFYDHSTRELYQFPLDGAQRVKNLGFAYGWLITAEENCAFHLVNILSGTRISLPPATFIITDGDDCNHNHDNHNYSDDFNYDGDENGDYCGCLLSIRNLCPVKATCSPIGPDGDGIVVLTYRARFFSLAVCRLSDQEWILLKDTDYNEVDFIDGICYTVSNNGEISTLDFTSSPKLVKIADLPQEIIDFNSNYCFTVNSHIAVCNGEIFIGVKIYAPTFDDKSLLADIRLFKLDAENKKVIDVKDIGDYALFFGFNHSFCLPTSLYKGLFRSNCIYFVDVDEFSNFANCGGNKVGEDIMIFNLEDQSFETYSVGRSKSSYSYPIWVVFDPFIHSK